MLTQLFSDQFGTLILVIVKTDMLIKSWIVATLTTERVYKEALKSVKKR